MRGILSRSGAGRQAGGGSAHAGVRWPHASRPSGARWETVVVRWAGPAGLPGERQVRFLSSLLFLFLLFF